MTLEIKNNIKSWMCSCSIKSNKIIKILGLLVIIYFLTSFFYKMITFVADVPSPYSAKMKQHLDEKLSDEEKKELQEIKKKSRNTRKKIAWFSLILALLIIFLLKNYLL